jgi:hypothetical protein
MKVPLAGISAEERCQWKILEAIKRMRSWGPQDRRKPGDECSWHPRAETLSCHPPVLENAALVTCGEGRGGQQREVERYPLVCGF